MTAGSVERALARARSWLATQDGPEAVIDAHEGGDAEREPDRARRWVRRILDRQGPDGEWEGSVVATASALMTIRELRESAGLAEQDPGVGRGLDWLRSRRGRPGAWTDGCSEERHERALCHHFSGGFFSPGSPDVELEAETLRSGATAVGDSEVRFVASATALRCLLAWSPPGRDSTLHLEGLRRVVDLWPAGPPSGLGSTALLAAVHALLHSSEDEDRAAAERGLRITAGRQRGDGSWVETDPFQALEVFTTAADRDVDPPRTRRALWHGARLLIAAQKPDGSWGGEDRAARRALAGVRTLRRVEPPRHG